MKTWNLVRGVLFVLVGFCAGVALNVFPIGTTVQGAPEPPVTPPAALKSVTHNATLAGDGTTTEPLGIASSGVGTGQIANGAVTAPKLSAAAIPTTGQVLGFNGANLAWQAPPVGGVRVVDSLGQLVGPYVGGVLRKIGGLTFAISVMNNGFYQGGFSYTFYHRAHEEHGVSPFGFLRVLCCQTFGKSNNNTSASNFEFTFLSIFSRTSSRPLTTIRAADRSNLPARSSISTLRSTLMSGVSAWALRSITSRQ